MSTFNNEHWDLNKTAPVSLEFFLSSIKCVFLLKKNNSIELSKKKFVHKSHESNYFQYIYVQQHTEGPPYMSEVVPPPFTPSIWNQEQPPPMVSYPELMGFPCSDLGVNLF